MFDKKYFKNYVVILRKSFNNLKEKFKAMKKIFVIATLSLISLYSYAENYSREINSEEFYKFMNNPTKSLDDTIIQNFYLNSLHFTKNQNYKYTNIFCQEKGFCLITSKNNKGDISTSYSIEGFNLVNSDISFIRVTNTNLENIDVRYYILN